MARSTEVVKIEDWTPYVLGDQKMPLQDSEDVSKQIQEDILNAPDIDAILRAGEAVSADEVANLPMRFEGAELRRGSFDSGIGHYCLIRCTSLDTGEPLQVTCGGLKVVTKLWAAYQRDAYPFTGMFSVKPIEGGKTVKSIVPLPEHRVARPIEATVVEDG